MNEMKKMFRSESEEATEAFAASLASRLPRGTVLALHGNLGAGKTVFSRGFARGLGITEPVSSPTYTIIQEYPLPEGGYLYHLDLYRIADERAALVFGVDEYLNDPSSWVLLEWSERIAGILPPDTRHLTIHAESESVRVLTLDDTAVDFKEN